MIIQTENLLLQYLCPWDEEVDKIRDLDENAEFILAEQKAHSRPRSANNYNDTHLNEMLRPTLIKYPLEILW